MRHTITNSRDVDATRAQPDPQYVPVDLASELAVIICRSFTGRDVRLKPLEIHSDRITLAVIDDREA